MDELVDRCIDAMTVIFRVSHFEGYIATTVIASDSFHSGHTDGTDIRE